MNYKKIILPLVLVVVIYVGFYLIMSNGIITNIEYGVYGSGRTQTKDCGLDPSYGELSLQTALGCFNTRIENGCLPTFYNYTSSDKTFVGKSEVVSGTAKACIVKKTITRSDSYPPLLGVSCDLYETFGSGTYRGASYHTIACPSN